MPASKLPPPPPLKVSVDGNLVTTPGTSLLPPPSAPLKPLVLVVTTPSNGIGNAVADFINPVNVAPLARYYKI